MTSYQTNAIILKRENIFEADRVYYLYTEDFGKVRAMAGGIRKINAKLAGHLEPFNIVCVELMTKKNGDLFIATALSFSQLLHSNARPAKIALFAKMADFALKMLKGQEKDAAIWNFLLNSFSAAGKLETGAGSLEVLQSSGRPADFFNDYKSGLIGMMGFGDNLEEALWYNY